MSTQGPNEPEQGQQPEQGQTPQPEQTRPQTPQAPPPNAPASPSPPPPPPVMAAPAIPNLLSRLGGRGARGRGRPGRAKPPVPRDFEIAPDFLPQRFGAGPGMPGMPGMGAMGLRPPHMHMAHASHMAPQRPQGPQSQTPTQRMAAVQGTDTDAALSRLSAVDAGLLDDAFARFFAGDGGAPAPRRLPIINRGTYTRTTALDALVRAFIHSTHGGKRQVVSLGAGTDTRALRLLAGPGAARGVVYHEIDFSRSSERKRAIVQAVPEIRALLAGAPVDHAPTSWSVGLGTGSGDDANTLYSHGIDLRTLGANADADADADTDATTALPGLDRSLPTLLVSECCLCYLQPDEAVAVLRFLARDMPDAGAVIYEPIRPHDAFGRTMVANLAARGIDMPTLAAVPDGAAQDARLTADVGLARADHRSMDVVWETWVSEAERERVNALDPLDEVEEWQLLASHYVVAWGSRGPFFDGLWASAQSV